MRDLLFENDLIAAIKNMMVKHKKTGQLELHLPDGSARVTWVGKNNDEDLFLDLKIERVRG